MAPRGSPGASGFKPLVIMDSSILLYLEAVDYTLYIILYRLESTIPELIPRGTRLSPSALVGWIVLISPQKNQGPRAERVRGRWPPPYRPVRTNPGARALVNLQALFAGRNPKPGTSCTYCSTQVHGKYILTFSCTDKPLLWARGGTLPMIITFPRPSNFSLSYVDVTTFAQKSYTRCVPPCPSKSISSGSSRGNLDSAAAL